MRLRIDGGGSPMRTGVMTKGVGMLAHGQVPASFSGAWPWPWAVTYVTIYYRVDQELSTPNS